MNSKKEVRQATALIRRQRNVEEYRKALKTTFEEFCEEKGFDSSENEKAKKALFKANREGFSQKLKKAEQEVAVLEARLNPSIV